MGGSVAIYHLEKPSGIRVGNTFEVSGEQTHKGVELNLYGEITPAIRLLGGASYIDSEMATTTEGINQGRSAIGVPEFQLNLGGEWDTPLINHLTLTSRIIYTGEQYADQSGRIELPHWTRVDIGARYTTKAAGKPLVLRANLENLFNESSWGVSNAGYLYVGDARSLQLSATIDF